MRKLIVICCLLTVTGVLAQTDKGSVYIGAMSNLSFTSDFVKGGERSTSIQLSALGGLFLMDDFLLNANVYFSRNVSGDFSSQNIAVGPGLRYYFGEVFIGGSHNFSFGSLEGPNSDTRRNQMLTTFELGYAAFLSRSIAVEPALYYSISSLDSPNITVTTIGLRIGFGIYSRKN